MDYQLHFATTLTENALLVLDHQSLDRLVGLLDRYIEGEDVAASLHGFAGYVLGQARWFANHLDSLGSIRRELLETAFSNGLLNTLALCVQWFKMERRNS